MPGTAEAETRVVGAVGVLSASTVTEDRVSRSEPPTRTVSVAIATNTQAPTASEIVLSGWLKTPAIRCVVFIANKFRPAPVADDLVWPLAHRTFAYTQRATECYTSRAPLLT
jgi:hypothetical protein